MEQVPAYLSVVFVLTTILTILLFCLAARRPSLPALLVILLWLLLQSALALSGFYTVTDSVPPRFLLAVVPPLLLIAALFSTRRGRQYIDAIHLKTLSLLHIVRIPVELVLWGLYLHGAVPKLMTFEGGNPDILSGLTAPVVCYFGFANGRIRKAILIAWHVVCLALLINIVARAVFAAPLPFQQLAFEQPNIAILHFPFVWLAACVVPLVLLAHLAALRQLFRLC